VNENYQAWYILVNTSKEGTTDSKWRSATHKAGKKIETESAVPGLTRLIV
jgi:hypothetical protein